MRCPECGAPVVATPTGAYCEYCQTRIKIRKESCFTKSASSDITFCISNCGNIECDRNTKSNLYKRSSKFWMSMSDFKDYCTDFIEVNND